MQFLLYLLIATGYVLFITVAVLLVRTYQRTQDIGFVWLGAAVLVWPLLARLLGVVVDRSLVLLLVAVLYLGRTKHANTSAV